VLGLGRKRMQGVVVCLCAALTAAPAWAMGGVGDRLGEVGGEALDHPGLRLGPGDAMWMAFGYCWPLKRQPRAS
jgi:hypothetical protein